MVALYEPERQWLFSADLFIHTYIGYFIDTESMAEQIANTKRVLALDFKVMFCGHNPQLKNAKERLAKKLDFLETFFEAVATRHRQGLTPRAIFADLGLKENTLIKTLSGEKLSKLNMVKSVIRDLELADSRPIP